MGKYLNPKDVAQMASQIATAYVSHNTVPVSKLPGFLRSLAYELRRIDNDDQAAEHNRNGHAPAVPVRMSVSSNEITCLFCGQTMKLLRSHLTRKHHVTPDDYRRSFGLKDDYPMTAPDYSKRRSVLSSKPRAKRRLKTGPLGRLKNRPTPVPTR